MAKKEGAGGCLVAFLIIIICGAFVLLSNIFNFQIMFSHSPSQYISNIKHFHTDAYCQAKMPTNVYKDIIPVSEMNSKTPVASMSNGSRFQLKGYRSRDYVTWVAVKIFDGPKLINGYFLIPENISIPTFSVPGEELHIDNKFFRNIPDDDESLFRANMFKVFKGKLEARIKVMTETNKIAMQKIRDSNEFGPWRRFVL